MKKEQKTGIGLTDWDRECMAWHEAGHAVCALVLPESTPVLRVSIVPGDDAFGLMCRAPRPHHNETERSLRTSISILLAGGISERLFLKRKTTSPADDIRNANQIACNMVFQFGMGRRTKWFSVPIAMEKTGASIRDADADMRDILDDSAKETECILIEHADFVRLLALRLLAEGTIHSPELLK